MKNKHDLSRREFIRNSMMAGGAMLLSGVLPSQAQTSLFPVDENSDSFETDGLLRGVSDIHLHAAPDSKARLGNELEFARAAHKADYKSMLFKSNDFSCHDRAYLIRQELPDFEAFGSLCMNRVHGDKVNVFAAEKAIATTQSLPLYLDADAGCCLSEYPLSWQKRGNSGIGRQRSCFAGSCPCYGNMRRGEHHFCHRTLFSRRKHCNGS